MQICFEPYAGSLGAFEQEELLGMIVQAGYDGIDVPISAQFFDFESEEETQKLAARCAEFGLATPAVCAMPAVHITDPARRPEALKFWGRCIEVGAAFGASSLCVWPPIPPGVYYEDAWDCCLANLEELLPKARELSVDLAIEFEKGCLVDNYRDGIRFCQEIGEGLKLVADTMHIYNDKADPARCVRAAQDYIAIVHASESDRKVPGTGEFDHQTFYDTLKEVGYDGPVSLQYKAEGVVDMKQAQEFIRACVA